MNQQEAQDNSRWLYTMPPEPGEEGLVGLAGIDSDQDGIRDDVQRFIAASSGQKSEETSRAIIKMARTSQKVLSQAYDKEAVMPLILDGLFIFDCYLHATNNDPERFYKRLEAKTHNTIERLKAWNKINSYLSGSTLGSLDDPENQCAPILNNEDGTQPKP